MIIQCTVPPGYRAGDDVRVEAIHQLLMQVMETLTEPRFWPEVEVRLTTMTTPEGRPTATPIVYVSGHELSLEQAEALARVLTEQVATARRQDPA